MRDGRVIVGGQLRASARIFEDAEAKATVEALIECEKRRSRLLSPIRERERECVCVCVCERYLVPVREACEARDEGEQQPERLAMRVRQQHHKRLQRREPLLRLRVMLLAGICTQHRP